MIFRSIRRDRAVGPRAQIFLTALLTVASLLALNTAIAHAKTLSSGAYTTCAVTSTNNVNCWGYNGSGILGQPSSVYSSPTPLAVAGIGGTASAVEVGEWHACALRTSGAVRCWGGNAYGQLGNGTLNDSTLPVAPTGLGTASGVSGGIGHTCAVVAGGIRCWGDNEWGQLGNGTTNSSKVPVAVKSLGGTAVQVDANGYSTCARLSTGKVKCWGLNEYGQLGNGKTTDSRYPVTVSNVTNAIDLASANESACAALSSGVVKCWGTNYAGQLGSGDFSSSSVPRVVVSLGGNATSVSMSLNQSCARLSTGTSRCWGRNESGQLGDGTLNATQVPVTVLGLGVANDVTTGSSHTCARLQSSGIRCWGDNSTAQLGTGSLAENPTPVQMGSLPVGAIKAAPGSGHTCVALIDGSARCTGYNASGQLGDGTNTLSPTPVAVTGLGGPISDIDSASSFSCALRTNGTVKCWGYNFDGELGNGSTTNSNVPVDVVGLSGVTQIETGLEHACALRSDGAVLCWGSNTHSQLGNGGTTSSSTPVLAKGPGSSVSKIALGAFATCVILSDGTPECWGDGPFGPGTVSPTTSPTPLSFLGGPVSEIGFGTSHACAVMVGGAVKCWGSNDYGQLGDGTTNDAYSSAVTVSLGRPALSVVASGHSSCAILDDGTAKCWGRNEFGQLGDGTRTARTTPVDVIGLPGAAVQIASYGSMACATISGGAVYCWGSDYYGNLGDGKLGWSVTPQVVIGF